MTKTALIDSLRTGDARTENNAVTHSTTLSACLDLFASIGASRDKSLLAKDNLFQRALIENKVLALKILFWARDIRGGAGERETFRQLTCYLAERYPELISPLLHLIPKYGRWDDLLPLLKSQLKDEVLALIATALAKGDHLCAKWLPRESGSQKQYALQISTYLNLSAKQYRKRIADLSQVVEQQMSAGAWQQIDYSWVPSQASRIYRRAFAYHDGDRYQAYLEQATKGEVKVNAQATFPHEIVKPLLQGRQRSADRLLLEAQWENLPRGVSELNALAVCDVSGSMQGLPLEVSVSLGIYLSERCRGPFQDAFITFSAVPKLQVLKGTLSERVDQLNNADWDGNTNLTAVFGLILSTATKHKLSDKDLPQMILILSDMEFDAATGGRTNYQQIQKEYKEAGYKMPALIFWNLSSRSNENQPVQMGESGTALISGYSPAVLKGLLQGQSLELKQINPMSVMLATLETERYADIQL